MMKYFSEKNRPQKTAAPGMDWEEIFEVYLPRVFHFFCYREGNADVAEELTAQTFEKAWAHRQQYCRERGEVQAWLLGIARNVASDHFRRPSREVELEEAHNLSTQTALEDDLQRRMDFQKVVHILGRGSQLERDLVALKYGAELTNRQIARLTGLSESNVGTILHRVVSRIRKEWEYENE
jgi:RNA polymerase sigma-70 factor (ECF subfamily)